MRERDNKNFIAGEGRPLACDKVIDANAVEGDPIVTVSGAQVIPITSITIVNAGGGGEYGDAKTFKINQGFKLAGGNGSVIAVKPRAFLVDDGSGCRLLKMEDEPVNALIEKTGELVHDIAGV